METQEETLPETDTGRITTLQAETVTVTRDIARPIASRTPLALPVSGTATGAEAVLQMLLAEGVDTVFGYPGGAIMPVYDALFDYQERIHHVLVRHEQGAAHAAEGYARATGKVGVCLATSGPGATNLVTGIANAMMDSVPMVCITGQVVGSLLGSDAFQETDVIGITIPITKWNCLVRDARDIPRVLAKAFSIARSGRPGPVVIDITKDAQRGSLEWAEVDVRPPAARHAVGHAREDELRCAAQLLNNAERPLILAGHGVLISRAERELIAAAEKGGIPIASTLLGLSACPHAHPLFVGMLGMHGNYAPNRMTNRADVILAVGMRFDDRVTGDVRRYATQARIIHIEIDPAEVGKIVKPAVAIVADAKEALRRLLPLLETRRCDEWLTEAAALREHEEEKVIRRAIAPEHGNLKTSEVVQALSEAARGEAIVVSDVGQHQMMTARYFRASRPNSFITSGGLGTMGFALPAGIGAALGAGGSRPVIVVCGDGSFQMTMQELGTIMQERLPVKIVVMNNGYLGMVRQWQELFHDRRYSSVKMTNPDFITLASAFGIPARRVTDRAELGSAIEAMLECDGPYCLEAVVEEEQNVFPMVPAGASLDEMLLE